MFRKPTPSSKKAGLSQFGLLDIPDTLDDDEAMDVSDDDMDLEAELAAISGGGAHRARPKRPAPSAPNLDAMIAASLKDIPSDDELGSGDEDDPDLLNELNELTVEDSEAPPAAPPRRLAPAPPSAANSTVSLLQERISNYTLAESNAKANGESSRARRFNRGLKTLNDLLKQAKAGKPINVEDIPPPVSTGKKAGDSPAPTSQPPSFPPPQLPSAPEQLPSPPEAPPSPPEVPPSPPEAMPSAPEESPSEPEAPTPGQELDPEKMQGMQFILKRKEEFKAAALSAKHAGDKPLALELLKVVKQFDVVLDYYKSGQEMDLSELPTPEAIVAGFKSQQREEDTVQHNAAEPAPSPAMDEETGLITASTVDEALRQRLAVFQEQEAKAKEQGNSSKQRRMGRIVKQYQDAIKLHAAGKPIPTDELPTPPGYAPIPTSGNSAPPPAAAPRPAPAAPAAPAPRARAPAPRPPAAGTQATRADKQLAFLMQRQKEFKEAALGAKKEGNIAQAKEYLRAAKGFDAVIDAASGGLAVDLKSLPLPPQAKQQLEQTFDIVNAEDCDPPDSSQPSLISVDDEDVMSRLHQQLNSQLKLCLANRDHYKAMGNVAETNRFEHMAVSVKQDLDLIVLAKRLGQDPPKFHYESRQFSVVQCNTDLNENDLELTIVRGIAYNVPNPKEVDTYVKFEFPYPQETPVIDRTSLVKDTNSPEYNAVFPLVINRSQRPCQRVFKRHGIKFEVYSRGGWFSKDHLLGSLTVKLAPLETHVTLHEAFPLMEGRRAAGGSLEVKLRVRTPLQQQQFDNTTHRWLIIDN